MPEHAPGQAHNPLVLLGRAATAAVEEYGYGLTLVGESVYWIMVGPFKQRPVRLAATAPMTSKAHSRLRIASPSWIMVVS